ncbi:NAD(P)/FAD-dependent oxidoreductase [Solimicrobium silvestre]|uniref:Pyridine nucleotide-disulfide oxidoreductase n=1 Tax=Solimicrobium silvestre TaxID=2099400 RepID=A0A2S9GXM1_9BURK|nr:FAD/NAD(P)-binding oxidoreductase [Solimicrobium silvestre]PRC92477.1 Pyridine nucleotide-disulfide oxidoreductase [Solimicrobium silvestre]
MKQIQQHTDILILGSGPAGLAAADAAASSEQSVTVLDDNFAPGGQIWRGGPTQWSDARAKVLWQKLITCTNVHFLYEVKVVAAPRINTLLLETPQGACSITYNRLIICSGARELLLPFPGWTLPGVTGAGGLQALIKGGLSVAGKRIAIAGTGPLLLAVAATVQRQGGQIVLIAEHRSTMELTRFILNLARSHRGKLMQAIPLLARLWSCSYRHATTVLQAHGDNQLQSISYLQNEKTVQLDCDYLACGYGLVPNLELAKLLTCEVQNNRVVVNDNQQTSQAHIWAAGEVTGIGGVDKALAEGRIAGLSASHQTASDKEQKTRNHTRQFAALLEHSFAPTDALRLLCQPTTLVCRCEDVGAQQLTIHPDWRSAKLATRCGMGACQGRICGAACEYLYGWQAPGLREPLFPSTAATLAYEPTCP